MADGVCREHVKTLPHIDALYAGDGAALWAPTNPEAVHCGVCRPRGKPVRMPDLEHHAFPSSTSGAGTLRRATRHAKTATSGSRQRFELAAAADIPSGAMQAFDADGRRVLVCNVGGEFHAVDELCPHLAVAIHVATLAP